jgi:hypothetical protein
MLASLLVAGVMTSGVLAQDAPKKGDGHRHARHMPSFKDMVGSDDGKLTEDLFVKGVTKNAPEERKEKATTFAKGMWKRLAGDKTELTKDEFQAAVKKMRETWKNKGKKGDDAPKEKKDV